MLPIKDNVPASNVPVAMWTIIGINVLVFFGESSLDDQTLQTLFANFGVVPSRFAPTLQVLAIPALLTNMFLHGGLMHLIGNMWTLYLFGDNVEDRMGPGRFAAFYLLCGLAASATHIWTNPGSDIPAVGASGAIAGVMGAYAFMFPKAKISFMVLLLVFPYFFQIAAWLYFGGWFLIQYLSAASIAAAPQLGGGIAFWAHLGGFVAGIVLHRLFVHSDAHPQHLEPTEIPFEQAWQ